MGCNICIVLCLNLFLQKLVSSGALVQSQVANECGGTSTPASQMSRSSGGPTISSGRSGKSTKSLEYIYEQTTEPSPAVKPGILALLEVLQTQMYYVVGLVVCAGWARRDLPFSMCSLCFCLCVLLLCFLYVRCYSFSFCCSFHVLPCIPSL